MFCRRIQDLGTPQDTFTEETIETFISVTAAKERPVAIDSATLPEHREALEMLARLAHTWLGLRKRPDHDF